MGRPRYIILWTESLEIAKEVYKITTKERFLKGNHLRRHIRKTVISLNIEISEAFEKKNSTRKHYYLKKAIRLSEKIKDSLNCALYLGYINDAEFRTLIERLEAVLVQLKGLIHKSSAVQERICIDLNNLGQKSELRMNVR